MVVAAAVAAVAAAVAVVVVVVVVAGVGRRFLVSNLEYTLSQDFPKPTAARQLIRSIWPWIRTHASRREISSSVQIPESVIGRLLSRNLEST